MDNEQEIDRLERQRTEEEGDKEKSNGQMKETRPTRETKREKKELGKERNKQMDK